MASAVVARVYAVRGCVAAVVLDDRWLPVVDLVMRAVDRVMRRRRYLRPYGRVGALRVVRVARG